MGHHERKPLRSSRPAMRCYSVSWREAAWSAGLGRSAVADSRSAASPRSTSASAAKVGSAIVSMLQKRVARAESAAVAARLVARRAAAAARALIARAKRATNGDYCEVGCVLAIPQCYCALTVCFRWPSGCMSRTERRDCTRETPCDCNLHTCRQVLEHLGGCPPRSCFRQEEACCSFV